MANSNDDNFANALAHVEQRRYAEAYSSLQQLDQADLPAGEVNYYLGICCRYLGEHDSRRAEEGFGYLLKAKLVIDPLVRGLLYMQVIDHLATTAWILNRLEDARLFYEEGLHYLHWYRAPNAPRPRDEYNYHVRLSEVYLYQDRCADALNALDRTLPVLSGHTSADELTADYRYRRGRVLHYVGRNEEALLSLERVAPVHLDLKSLLSYYYVLIRVHDAKGDHLSTWSTFQQMEHVGIGDAYREHAYYYAGKALYHLGRAEEAKALFEIVLATPIRHVWTHESSREYLAKIKLGHSSA